ncbi:MAG TPA: bifunctional precorrin-2 dehydrogenase/sirohydrochlorin ferrochelatase [Acidimicrobiales bacterium]|nr:bifunctional precorrin-2 dehydrogenase/sirohydrochlorin ferrochelatase [Acidimicrobiales bacterium]
MPVDAPLYPVSLVVEGRRVLVVGRGTVADGKVKQLAACGALVDVVAPDEYRPGHLEGYRLVITAAEDPTVNRTVHDDAEAAGVWVNSADDPANCSFTLPAVARRGPVTVAVSTGGQSPALATWLRRKFEAELGPEYEILAELLATERAAIRAGGGSTEGLDWQSALDSGMLDLIRAGQVQEARERLQACLSSS